jgi:hypothetical protein
MVGEAPGPVLAVARQQDAGHVDHHAVPTSGMRRGLIWIRRGRPLGVGDSQRL